MQQGFSVSLFSILRFDEKILEVDAGLPQEGGVVVEEKGEADRDPAFKGEEHLGHRALPEEGGPQVLLGGGDFVGEFLVVGQGLNKGEDEGGVVAGGGADGETRMSCASGCAVRVAGWRGLASGDIAVIPGCGLDRFLVGLVRISGKSGLP